MAHTSRLSLVALALLSVPQAVVAQHSVAADERVREALAVVETWLEAQQAYEQIPAFSAAIVHDQELVWSTAQGLAHPGRGVAATPETLYSICSISKLFTSVALMQLRDQGLVSLRDPVAKHLPWFDLEQRYEGSPPITIEGILSHSAGLPRESDHPYWTGPDFPFPTREQIIEGLSNQETLYPARKYYQYSNLGLTLAGEIVREVSGLDYGDYVRRNVLDPLGMENTFPEIPEQHRGGRLATGYSSLTRDGTRREVQFFQARGIAPAAGYASTAEDLARFASWQLRLTGDREEVLHAHTLDEMQRPHYVDTDFEAFRGLGFGVYRSDDKTFVGHGGSCPGFRSQLWIQRDEKIATVFMANAMVGAGTFARGMYNLVSEAIVTAAEKTEEGMAEHAPMADDDQGMAGGMEHRAEHHPGEEEEPDLTPYLGNYSSQPWGGETAVVKWQGGLAAFGLPTGNPKQGLRKYEHVEGDVFRRVRDDGELGEAMIFERDESGTVTGYRIHGQLSPRMR